MIPTTAITRFELGSTFEEFDLRMNIMKFIGAKILKPRRVGVAAANIGKVPLKQLLQSAETKRAPGAGYARDTFEFDTWAYAVEQYGKESPLDDALLAIYGDIIDAERISVDRAEEAVLNQYERDVAAKVMDTALLPNAPATGLWTNRAAAEITADVMAACQAVEDATGMEANTLVVTNALWRSMVQADDIVDKIKPTSLPGVNAIQAALAELLGIKQILVAGGFKNTANEGQAAAISRIWGGTSALVCRVAETDDPQEACIGRTFMFDGDGPSAPGDGGALAVIVEEYRDEKVRGTVYRARNNRDIQIMYPACGHIITGVAA